MANPAAPRRRARGKSFTARFVLVLVAVGLATAVVAGALAWVEAQQAQAQQQLAAGRSAANLAASLLRMQTASSSQRFACEVAGLSSTEAAFASGSKSLVKVASAAVAHASAGQVVLLLSPGGAVLARAPSAGPALSQAAALAGSAGGATTSCARTSTAGFYARSSARGVVGVGVAEVERDGAGVGRVVVVSPVSPAALRYVQQLADTAGLHATPALLVEGRLALPLRFGGTSYPAGSQLPAVLTAAPRSGGAAGPARLGSSQLAVAERELRRPSGRPAAQLLVLESDAGPALTVAGLALPLALAVAGVLLLGMVLVFLLVEHFLNRPLRRLDVAVQRLGMDAYATPVQVEAGSEEITRLAGNLERVRKQLRRQLLIATGRSVIASTLTGTAPVDEALGQVLRSLANLLEADLALLLLRPHAQMPRGAVILPPGTETTVTFAELESSSGLLGGLVREPRFVARNHLAPEERAAPEEQLNLRDCLVEPLRSEDHDLGLLVVVNKHTPYVEEDYTLCRGVAEQIVIAVDKSTRLAVTQREATTDAMTALYNYRFLIGYLDQQVNVAERAGAPLSVLMLDLDHFKEVNDTYGHPAGDRLLRQFAALMVETIRKSDLAARYGGEEFVVVMANTARADALTVADKIRQAVEAMMVRLDDGAEVRITVSIGGVTFPEGSKGARNLLDLADRALYAAKRNGRNRVEFLDLAAPAAEPVGS